MQWNVSVKTFLVEASLLQDKPGEQIQPNQGAFKENVSTEEMSHMNCSKRTS